MINNKSGISSARWPTSWTFLGQSGRRKKREMGEKRQQFGNRLLNDESKVFEHNSWDRVDWSDEQAEQAKAQIQAQLEKA